jgi:hypothetical protein
LASWSPTRWAFQAGGRNLEWLNPESSTQQDVFLARGRFVYRVATVVLGAGEKSTAEIRRAAFTPVNRLACTLPGAGCSLSQGRAPVPIV